MSRTSRAWSCAPAPRLFLAGALGALLATGSGCIGDLARISGGSAPAAQPGAGPTGSLWDYAPADAVAGVVVQDGALSRLLALVADADGAPARAGFEELVQDETKLPFNPVSPEGWAGAGIDPHRGAAAFSFADKKRPATLVLPVVDRALFRRAFGLHTRLVGGREMDQLDDDTVCEPTGDRYLCARSQADIAAAAAPHASALATSARAVEEHGEVEVYVSRDDHGIARFNHEKSSPGSISAVTGTLRLREDGATLHLHAAGLLATPMARGFYGALPPGDLLAAVGSAASVGRVHVDPTAIFPASADVEPEVRSELLEQLTGDAEILPSGAGFADATMILPVHDAARVEAFVKKRCAEEAAKKERKVLGGFKVEAHGCAGVLDSRNLTIPLSFPRVPVTAIVADQRLVITVGDPKKSPSGDRADAAAVDGDAARHALEDPQTFVFFAHDLGIGPEVDPGAPFRAAIPLLGGKVAAAVEAWSYASAHLSQAFARARVTDEGADLTIDLTGFEADPPAAHEAYGAALKRRFAGDDAGYRGALAAIEKAFPGTRAARRAAEVRKGAPFFGVGIATLATLRLLGSAGKRK